MSSKLCLIIAVFGLAGCARVQKPIDFVDPAFGESVKYNAAIQTINPAPVYSAANAQPGSSGDKGASAVRRYRTDQVNARHSAESATLSTTTQSSGGGGSR